MNNNTDGEQSETTEETAAKPVEATPVTPRPMTFLEQVSIEALTCKLADFPAEFAKTKRLFTKEFLIWSGLTVLYCLYYMAALLGRLHRELQPSGRVLARIEFDLRIISVSWVDLVLYGPLSLTVLVLMVSYVAVIKRQQRTRYEIFDYIGRRRGIVK